MPQGLIPGDRLQLGAGYNAGMRTAGAAFTLIELLMVVAVVALLSAMLMPAITLLRSASRGAVCMSNLRQIGLGLGGYQNEWEGLLPPPIRKDSNGNLANYPGTGTYMWYGAVSDYLEGNGIKRNAAAVCPAADFRGWPGYNSNIHDTGLSYGYTGNTYFAGWVLTQTQNYTTGFNPGAYPYRGVALLGERWGFAMNGAGPVADCAVSAPYIAGYTPMEPPYGRPGSSPNALRLSHRMKSTYLFLDNHVELLGAWERVAPGTTSGNERIVTSNIWIGQ